jgi:hypothetical protein
MDLHKKLISEIRADKKQRGSILEEYRPALIEMKRRYFSHREMAEMMNKVGIKISRQAITNYLMKMPITTEELNGKNESNSVDLDKWKRQTAAKKSRSKKPVFFDISKPFK